MSFKNQAIPSIFKKTKNPQRNVKREKALPKPSTSKAEENDLRLLRDFDLNWVYGPCMGITRLERWNRAEKHGLNPPAEVKQLVLANAEDEQYTHCVWNDYKNIM